MRKLRRIETAEERSQRVLEEAQMKKEAAAAEEHAVDRMIRQNIINCGP